MMNSAGPYMQWEDSFHYKEFTSKALAFDVPELGEMITHTIHGAGIFTFISLLIFGCLLK